MEETSINKEMWDLIIQPKKRWFNLHLHELWQYNDLISLFVKRDFVTFYKQTILGPIWYLLQPLLTTLVFTVIFSKVAHISTDGIPPFIFYLSGTICWSYFANCLKETSTTFVKNTSIFGKVYFPRLTIPISVVIINLAKFSMQLLLFLGFYVYFIMKGSVVRPTGIILLLPVFIFQMALLGLGTGIIVSSLTTKYRDLSFVMGFGVQLWMYATPVVYPASIVSEKYRWLYMLNPMASVLELFRYAFLGNGTLDIVYIAISWSITIFILFAGIVLFNRIEKTFMDTV
ncbi:MAG: ABC transporter permease [Planctomycetes bacterium]|nr:ABC transporter permease [Planctomycetota bacterium]